MKILKSIALLLLLALLVTNCRKDEITTSIDISDIPNIENVRFQFVITNLYNNTISNVEIQIGGETYYGGDDGIVLTTAFNVSTAGMKAKISAPGYNSLIKTVNGPPNSTMVETVVLTRSIVNVVSTGNTGEIAGGGTIQLPPSLLNNDGSIYTGDVSVMSNYLNPEDTDFLKASPGNMLGVDSEDNYRLLASMGMYEIELLDVNDQALQIPDGSKAILTFPLAENQQNLGFSDVPLWFFDEEINAWREEGIATVEENSIVAEVSHFSWWNCDFPFTFKDICITFLDANGFEISGLDLHFFVDGIAFGYSTTNAGGIIQEKMPLGKSIEVKLFAYGEEIERKTIGPFDENSGKQFVTLNQPIKTISGTARDCEENLLTDGYIFYKLDSRIYSSQFDANGNYSYIAPEVDHTLVFIDVANEKFFELPISEELQDSGLVLNDITVCDQQNMTRISGHVMVDTDGDQVADAIPTFGWLNFLNLENMDVKQVYIDEQGYYESVILPGIEYNVAFIELLYRNIAAGDISPEGNVEGELYEVGKRFINVVAEQNYHDQDNNFLVVPEGEGIVSGTFFGDSNEDGIGDMPLEWIELGFGKGLNFKPEGLVMSDGSFSFEVNTGYHELRTKTNFAFIVDWDTSADLDGDDSSLGPNQIIPLIIHENEVDEDNTFVVEYKDRYNLLCRVMEDTDMDGEGDVPVQGIKIELKYRETGQTFSTSTTNEYGIINRGWFGFGEEELSVVVSSTEYEVINVVDTSPDNDPFIIDGDKTKMEIDLVVNEWDAGNIFIVRKI